MNATTRAYIVCALWSSTGEDEEPLTRSTASTISRPRRSSVTAEVADFVAQRARASTARHGVTAAGP